MELRCGEDLPTLAENNCTPVHQAVINKHSTSPVVNTYFKAGSRLLLNTGTGVKDSHVWITNYVAGQKV